MLFYSADSNLCPNKLSSSANMNIISVYFEVAASCIFILIFLWYNNKKKRYNEFWRLLLIFCLCQNSNGHNSLIWQKVWLWKQISLGSSFFHQNYPPTFSLISTNIFIIWRYSLFRNLLLYYKTNVNNYFRKLRDFKVLFAYNYSSSSIL